MFIQVNQELCDGCGVCVEACPVGAIQLVDQRAVIDDALCTQCEACIDACPDGALTALSVPANSTPLVALPAAESSMIPAPIQTALSETEAPAHGLALLAGAALTFLGREVAPRLVDVLITALERRLARPTTTAIARVSTPSRSLAVKGRGERRQARFRGGCTGNRNLKERR
jgi:ferredoxin